MNTKRAALVIWLFFGISIIGALHYTFQKLNLFMSALFISNCFIFFYFARNPEILVAKNWDDFDYHMDHARNKNFLSGGTPIYPAVLLAAILYIAAMKYGLGGAL